MKQIIPIKASDFSQRRSLLNTWIKLFMFAYDFLLISCIVAKRDHEMYKYEGNGKGD